MIQIARIYQDTPLTLSSGFELDSAASHYVSRVLRAKINDTLVIFNGAGGEYVSTITRIDKKSVYVTIETFSPVNRESSAEIYLAQGISRGEKMDFTIQKAVELGVKKIFPIITERCNVRFDDERTLKRLKHWRSIIISACEQCGRNVLPTIESPQSLELLFAIGQGWQKWVLAPKSEKKLSDYALDKQNPYLLLVGPEGGLTTKEIELAQKNQYFPLTLGPRILRTETAGVTALSILQFLTGDLN